MKPFTRLSTLALALGVSFAAQAQTPAERAEYERRVEEQFSRRIYQGRSSALELYYSPHSPDPFKDSETHPEFVASMIAETDGCEVPSYFFIRDQETSLATGLRYLHCDQHKRILRALGLQNEDLKSYDTGARDTFGIAKMSLKTVGDATPKNAKLWELVKQRFEGEMYVHGAITIKLESGQWRNNVLLQNRYDSDSIDDLKVKGITFSAYLDKQYQNLKSLNQQINKELQYQNLKSLYQQITKN